MTTDLMADQPAARLETIEETAGAIVAAWPRMARLTQTAVVLVAILTGCASSAVESIEPFIDSNKADGHSTKLKLLEDHKLDLDEPSDLAMADGKLYAVSDQHSKIYRIHDDGDVEDTLDIEGTDLEALAYDDGKNNFLVADESSAKIWFIGADGERHDPIEIDDAQDGNSGIEGLAFDDDGHLFVAKEKNPSRIFELDKSGDVVDEEKVDFADDISALAWNSDDHHLYALSDEEHALYRLDKNFEIDHAWRLPMKHPEGIAFDGDTVYIVSDSEEKLYVFELDND